jgi:hypothetical protein
MMHAQAITPEPTAAKKRSLMSRFRLSGRRHKHKTTDNDQQREGTPSPTSSDREELAAIVTPSGLASKGKKSRVDNARREIKLDKAPTAREAAFGGPPRYDWIDIVSHSLSLLICESAAPRSRFTLEV